MRSPIRGFGIAGADRKVVWGENADRRRFGLAASLFQTDDWNYAVRLS